MLCAQVAAWLGTDDIRLSRGGRDLEETEPLSTYNVQRHSVLLALPRLRGGGGKRCSGGAAAPQPRPRQAR